MGILKREESYSCHNHSNVKFMPGAKTLVDGEPLRDTSSLEAGHAGHCTSLVCIRVSVAA